TNNNAGEVIRALKETFADQLLVGAGTVLDPTTARLAIMDGAEFIIAPTFNKEVQEMANLYQIPYAPGCTSYTEMIEALKAGASFIKAF
ncbi:ketohydroxyglutarate aldolase, partial [Erysipelatoclostridium ramosum]|nr:ketohydroxyglutarate aldolase [Thomasclavelia ramosa]